MTEQTNAERWQDALPRPVGFVFSGGAAQGALQVGMLRALHEAGIRPDLVVGASVGSLNAAVVAALGLEDGIETLTELWSTLKRRDVFLGKNLAQIGRMLQNKHSIFPNDPLKKIIADVLTCTRFDELRLPLGVLATSLRTFEGVLFTEGELAPALLASAALPGVLPPVEMDGDVFSDGGLTSNVPLEAALLMDAAALVVLDAQELNQDMGGPDNIIEIVINTIMMIMRQRVQVEAQALAEKVPILYLPTPVLPDHELMDFSDGPHMIAMSYESTAEFLRTAPIPQPGRMSGAPHMHGGRPVEIVRMARAVAPAA
jgi:NTE family protein